MPDQIGPNEAVAAAGDPSSVEASETPTTGLKMLLAEIAQEVIQQDFTMGSELMRVMMAHWKMLKAFGETPSKMPRVFFDFFPIRYCNFAAP
ncbi:hypothetical protein N7488_005273 [Penicillium malachiteum]|nr:hypothetical protein N7488_005273 [Penicillium malachiteum]